MYGLSNFLSLFGSSYVRISGSIHPGDQIWISRLKKGGIAYRTGMLHSGDILLAINGASLESANLSQAAEVLKNAGDRVSLKVTKESGEAKHEHYFRKCSHTRQSITRVCVLRIFCMTGSL